jgi:hypothetical protein
MFVASCQQAAVVKAAQNAASCHNVQVEECDVDGLVLGEANQLRLKHAALLFSVA